MGTGGGGTSDGAGLDFADLVPELVKGWRHHGLPGCPEQHSWPWRSPRRPQRWLRRSGMPELRVGGEHVSVAHDGQALVQTVVWLMMMFSSLLMPPDLDK